MYNQMDTFDDDAPPNLRPLPPALQKIAIEELEEVPSRVADDVLALRQWIHKQPHLSARTNDQFLVGFLRGSKNSLEKAKQKIDRYYTLKAALPEVFNERRQVDDPMVMEILRLGIILQIPLPADYHGPCITIIRACSYDTAKYKFADIIRVGSMFGEIMTIEDDNSVVSGYIEIMDMSNVSGHHFLQLKPDLLRKCSTFAVEAMPMRQRGTHFINVPAPFEKGFRTLSSLFPEKTLSRISVSSNPEALYEFVPREYLPVEYGGENGTIADIVESMEEKLLRYRDHFLLEPKFGTNEKLREGSLFSYENCFGLDGSFRRLEVDYVTDVDDQKLRELINTGTFVYLPTPLHGCGPRINFVRGGLTPANKYTTEEIARAMQGIAEILLLEDDYVLIKGMVCVVDIEKATAAHFMQMKPAGLKKITVYSQEALPLRIKAVHFIHTTSGFETFFNLLKTMFPKKHQARFTVHGSKLDGLYEHIPLKYLPKEYGGENGSIVEGIAYLNKMLDEYRDFFKANTQYGTDENLRPGKPVDFDNMFGMEGSFRTLEVD